MISNEEFKHLAELSKLEFSDEERDKFIKDFNSVLDFASQINSAKVENKSFIKSIPLKDLREDVAQSGLSQDEVVSNAPLKKKGCFVVPRIMD